MTDHSDPLVPTAAHYVALRPELEVAAKEPLEMVGSRKVEIDNNQRYPLKDAGQAHLDLALAKRRAPRY